MSASVQPYTIKALGSCDPKIWSVLSLFSEKRYKEALGFIEEARASSGDSQDYWYMSFDMCNLANDVKLMDKLTAQYAMQFGVLPPSMNESSEQHVEQAKKSDGVVLNIFSMSKPEADTYAEIFTGCVSQKSPLKISCASIKKAETMTMAEEASVKLHAGITLLMGQKIPVYMEGDAIMNKIISIDPEKRKTAEWDLLFLIFQMLSKQALFEEAAVEYAISKGISPPSWTPFDQPPLKQFFGNSDVEVPKMNGQVTDQSFNGGHMIIVNGSLTTGVDNLIQTVMGKAATTNTMVADLRAVRHACWESAHKVMVLHDKLLENKKRLMVLEPTPMVKEMLRVTGIPEQSFVCNRKKTS